MALSGWIVLVLGINLAITAAQDEEIVILPRLDTQRKAVGESALFSCQVLNLSPNVQANLRWYDPNDQQIVEESGRRYIEKESEQTLKLYVTAIQMTDAGRYTCRGTVNGNMDEKSILLEIYKDITFDHAPTLQHPTLGSEGKVTCQVSGVPTPTVSWKYNGKLIPSGGRYSYENDGLRIKEITEDDNGDYVCRAEVLETGNLNERIIQVIVHIPPEITSGPGQAEGTENQEATISCQATGKPPPKYEFYKDDNPTPVRTTERIVVDMDKGDVHFRPVKREDEGKYTCKAINDVGEDNVEGYLDVIVPPRVTELKNITAKEGTTARLLCISEGDPAPTMTWRKTSNDFEYKEGDNGEGIKVTPKGQGRLELEISNLEPKHTHNYTCKAVNVGGEYRQNGTFTVEYKPRFRPNHIQEVHSWAGKIKNITCEAQGEPEPNVDWYSYGKLLKDNETYRVYKMGRFSNLQVKIREEDQGWIYGDYDCTARNKHGEDTLKINLKRAMVPDAPKSVDIKDKSPTMVTLTVVPPDYDGGVPVYGYRIEYDYKLQDFGVGDEIRIENLKPSSTYLFRVRAKNEVGVSEPQDYSFTTDSIREPYPIVIVSDPEGRYPTQYTLNWERPRTGGLPIREYEFKYRRVTVHKDTNAINEPQESWTRRLVQDDPEKPMLYYTLEALKPSTHYQVEVLARNDIGLSLPNTDFVFSTSKADGGVGEVVGRADHTKANVFFLSIVTGCLLCIVF